MYADFILKIKLIYGVIKQDSDYQRRVNEREHKAAGGWEVFWKAGNILFLDLGHYTDGFSCENSSN